MVIFITLAAAGGFGKPGASAPAGTLWPTLKQPSQRVSRGGVALRARSHSSGACLPCSDVAGPLGRAHFFLCQTSTHPCCALPSVHLGLFLGHLLWQGLTAGSLWKDHLFPWLPLPPSHPAAAGPSLQRLTQPATFLPPSMRASGHSIRGTFPPRKLVTVLTASVDALSSFPLGYKIAFSSGSCISPPRPPAILMEMGFRDSDSKEGRFPASQEMATPCCSSELTSLHVPETFTHAGACYVAGPRVCLWPACCAW